MNTMSPEQIVDLYGEFFTKKVVLGGFVSYIKIATYSESMERSDVVTELKAGFKFAGIGAEAEGGSTQQGSRSNTASEITQDAGADGGRTSLLKQNGDKEDDDAMSEWKQSVLDGEDLATVEKTLVPIWDLLEGQKRRNVKSFLTNKWLKEKRKNMPVPIKTTKTTTVLDFYSQCYENNDCIKKASEDPKTSHWFFGRRRRGEPRDKCIYEECKKKGKCFDTEEWEDCHEDWKFKGLCRECSKVKKGYVDS